MVKQRASGRWHLASSWTSANQAYRLSHPTAAAHPPLSTGCRYPRYKPPQLPSSSAGHPLLSPPSRRMSAAALRCCRCCRWEAIPGWHPSGPSCCCHLQLTRVRPLLAAWPAQRQRGCHRPCRRCSWVGAAYRTNPYWLEGCSPVGNEVRSDAVKSKGGEAAAASRLAWRHHCRCRPPIPLPSSAAGRFIESRCTYALSQRSVAAASGLRVKLASVWAQRPDFRGLPTSQPALQIVGVMKGIASRSGRSARGTAQRQQAPPPPAEHASWSGTRSLTASRHTYRVHDEWDNDLYNLGELQGTTTASCQETQAEHASASTARWGRASQQSKPAVLAAAAHAEVGCLFQSLRHCRWVDLAVQAKSGPGQAGQECHLTPCTPPHRLLDISNFARLGIPIASPSVLPHGVSRPGGALAALCTAAGQATIQPCSDRAVHARGAEAYDSVAVGRARKIDTRQPTGGTQPVRLPPPLSSRRPRTADVGPQLAHPCT